MPSTATEIANLALSLIGEYSITALNEASASARTCNLHYLPVRDALLRSHPWNFAQRRAVLVAEDDAPAFGWTFAYEIPDDCLCLTEVNGMTVTEPRTDYLIEGRQILTNASTLNDDDESTINVIYTTNAADVSDFDPLFVEVFTLKLAIAIAERITQSKAKAAELTQQLERISGPLARKRDANEERKPRVLDWVDSDSIRARYAQSYL